MVASAHGRSDAAPDIPRWRTGALRTERRERFFKTAPCAEFKTDVGLLINMAAFLQNADAPARECASRADYFLARVLVPARGPENRFSKNAHCADLKNRPKTSAPPVRGISNPHTLCGFGIVLCPLKKTESQEKTKNKKTPPLRRALKARGAGRRGHLLDRRLCCVLF